MLLSTVLHLSPLDDSARHTSARQSLRWFKGWLEETDADLFAALQAAAHTRAYTLSGAMPSPGDDHALWLRITSLNDALTGLLIERLPLLTGSELVFDPRRERARLLVERVDLGPEAGDLFAPVDADPNDPALWAGRSSYGQLINAVADDSTRPPLTLRLHFHTCTSFRRNAPGGFKSNLPLPVPRYVFQSWLRQWEAVSPAPLPVQMSPFFEHYVWLSYHNIRTIRAAFAGGRRGRVVGFGGEVEFGLPRSGNLPDEMREAWRIYVDVARLLAAFAFYCGTGISTSSGLGQTLPLVTPFKPPRR